ncbi:ABC lipoprotein transporter [Rhodococcus rhodnii LMG 5362]|uniref:ABC lipoprotein transporter n=1 Tax=Rhodococcus rhodnii LMG 5362 TaxID=1273125 RepID=R7WJD4_9NOCA|nr:ABC lipoprotein transporter [Rhodococcus rhodnii LMG 5362]
MPRRWTRGREPASSGPDIARPDIARLDIARLDIAAGALTAILGPSGSGKSTLVDSLAGVHAGSDTGRGVSGVVEIAGTRISTLRDSALTVFRRDHIGTVFASANLVPMFSARENILLPMRLAGREPADPWFDEIVARFGLAERLGHAPEQLTTYEQQCVALARALVSQPDVVFADEPTRHLDSMATSRFLGLLRASVREDRLTAVLTTHDPVVASYADRVVVLSDGRITGEIADPTPARVAAGLGELAGRPIEDSGGERW